MQYSRGGEFIDVGLTLYFGDGKDSSTFFLTGYWSQVLEMSDSTTCLVTELEATLGVRVSSWQAKGS